MAHLSLLACNQLSLILAIQNGQYLKKKKKKMTKEDLNVC